MTDTANSAQFEAWNGENGYRWVARADERDRVLAPVADVLIAAAAPSHGNRVLDIGCGCGSTTLMAAAQVGSVGSVLGVDLSEPMLEVARQRASDIGALNTSFMQTDAQTHRFEPGSVDLVVSRFGTMFFSAPDAAFRNIATALVPEGRLCLATWQPLEANEWLVVPGAALLQHADLPATSPDVPGMFAQSDPDIIEATLHAAGLGSIAIDAANVMFTIGRNVDEAVEYLADSGPGRALLDTIADGPARQAALADVRASLVDHQDASGVRLRGGIWLITATR